MKKIIIISLVLFTVNAASAQLKKLSIEDAMVKARTSLAPENLKQLQFIKGNKSAYMYLKKLNGTDTWMSSDFENKSESVLFDLSQFNQKLKSLQLDTVSSMPAISFYKDSMVTIVNFTI
jgi:dipeptidyl-peptidase-4